MTKPNLAAPLSDTTAIAELIALPQHEVFSLLETTIGRPQQVFDRELRRRVAFV
jgi:hypothetical protein